MSDFEEETLTADPIRRPDRSTPQSVRNFRPGDTLGSRFLIKDFIGDGGSGAVYSALDTRVGQRVAVKILRPELADDLNRERLRREVRAARPGHPNVVGVFDLHTDNGLSFLSMELVVGQSLRELLVGRGTLPVDEVVRVGAQAAAALAHLHGNGLVHRDVKPGNLLIANDGAVKVCDMGLARPLARGTTVTETAMVVGTPAYMAPEQATTAELTEASDIYALGLTLYRCLTGVVPLEGETAVETLMLRQRARPPRIAGVVPDCPRWLDRLLRWMLEPRPEDRPSAVRVAEVLSGGRLGRRLSRRALTGSALALVTAALVTVAAFLVGNRIAGRSLDPASRLMLRVEPFETGSSLEILDDGGNRLWRTVLEKPWGTNRHLRGGRRPVAFGDVTGDGLEDAVIIHQTAGRERPVELLVRRPDGTLDLRGAYPATATFEYEGTAFVGFQPIDVHCADLDGDGTDEIVLVEHSSRFYPAAVRILDADNQTLFQLWHPGVLVGAATGDRDGDGRPELYIGGTCNFLTPPSSNTSKPVMMILDADWGRRGQTLDLFGPDRSLASSVPDGVSLLYAAWDRLEVPAYRLPWQYASVSLPASNDPANFLTVDVSDVDTEKIGFKHSRLVALRTVVFDHDLRITLAQWNPLVSGALGIDPGSSDMQALLRPRYWTGAGWSDEVVLLPQAPP